MRTSARIADAASAAKTPGPESRSRAPPGSDKSNAPRKAATASRWASASRPAPRVRARSSARGGSAPAANQAPCRVSMRLSASQVWARPRKAPVGSAKPKRASSGDAALRRPSSRPSSLVRSAAVSKVPGRDARGEQVAIAEQQPLFGLAESDGAVAYEGEAVGGAEGGGGVARDPREVLRRGALDAGQEQAGGGAGAELADEELAPSAVAARKELDQPVRTSTVAARVAPRAVSSRSAASRGAAFRPGRRMGCGALP